MARRASRNHTISHAASSRVALLKVQSPSVRGFTIVELLIVVVVIAILAAISIAAYNGITNRAKQSAASSAAEQAAKKVLVYMTTNAEQVPVDLATAGVANSGSTTYQYTANSSVVPQTFCLTATVNSISYYVDNITQTTPVAGACAGQAPNGGTVITNRFMNPTFDGPSLPEPQSGAFASIATYNGSPMARGVATGAAFASIRLGPAQDRWNISAGQSVYGVATVCNAAAVARDFNLVFRYYDTSGSSYGNQLSTTSSAATSIPSGACQTLTINGVAPAGTQAVGISANRATSGGSAANDTFYADNVLMSNQTANFGAGTTPGWAWNGTPFNSTSTGPPQ